jgi:Leucine-rich repeat (LRR) protein
MELLECFQNLQELNLSDNEIRDLPNDMGGLKNVAILNINGNEFNDVRRIPINNDLYSLKKQFNLFVLYRRFNQFSCVFIMKIKWT